MHMANNLEKRVKKSAKGPCFIGGLPLILALIAGQACFAQILPEKLRAIIAEKTGIPAAAPDFDSRLANMPSAPLTDEMKRQGLARFFGVNPSNINLRDLSKRPDQKDSMVPQQVAARFEFDGGSELEKAAVKENSEEIKSNQALIRKAVKQDFSEAIANMNARTRESIERVMQPKSVPECTLAKTLEDDAPLGAINSDTLIISGASPINADELFGNLTRVISFKMGANADIDSIMVALAEPECLHYRVRVVDGKRFRHSGDFALRNFDLKPNGKMNRELRNKKK